MRKAKSAEIWKFRGGLTEEKNARESRRSAGAFAHDHTPMATHQDERRRKTNREGGKALCAIEARGENDQTRLGRLPGVSLAVGRANVAGVKYQGRQEEGRGPAPTRNGRGPAPTNHGTHHSRLARRRWRVRVWGGGAGHQEAASKLQLPCQCCLE